MIINIFSHLAILGLRSLEREQNILKIELLDVQKLDDTAENEPLQISDFDRSAVTYV